MSIKSLIQSALAPIGLELHRRPDPTLPLLHTFLADGIERKMWLSNPFTKSWWHKPEISLNGEFSALKRLCSAGSTVLEIGAHHGLMTLLMSGWAGIAGYVYAIEASADNAMVLDANCFQNKLANVSTAFLAIGKQAGTVRFGGESLAAASGVVREIPMVTADQFCSDQGIDHIDLLKIDVEGFEMGVLEGASEVLKRRPKLALELHVDLLPQAGSSSIAVWELLDAAKMFENRRITMLARPNWNDVQAVAAFDEVPKNGVVNLFVS